jgi:hypothetical protein
MSKLLLGVACWIIVLGGSAAIYVTLKNQAINKYWADLGSAVHFTVIGHCMYWDEFPRKGNTIFNPDGTFLVMDDGRMCPVSIAVDDGEKTLKYPGDYWPL